jgi:hypothetical protein
MQSKPIMRNPKFILALLPVPILVACQTVDSPVHVGGRPGSAVAREEALPAAPELARLPNGHYRVRRDWHLNFNGHRYVIPAGYSSNGITAPARLKAALGDGVNYRETWAAIFHDWLFTRAGNVRAEADRRFYELLLAYGVDPGKAKLMYSTVSAYSLSKNLD